MNIFNKVTLQSLKKSRTRTIVTIIGVILSTAMITAVSTFAVSLQSYMIQGSIAKYGGWHIGFPAVDSAFVQERAHDQAVSSTASFENIGYAALSGGKNPDKPYLFIAGFNEDEASPGTLPVTMVSGRMPDNSREILVPSHLAANGGIKFAEGDTLTLAVGDRMYGNQQLNQHDVFLAGDQSGKGAEALVPRAEQTYKVVGIYARPAFEESAAPGYTLITRANPSERADSFSLYVSLKHPREVKAYANSTAAGHAYVYNDNVLRFMGVSSDELLTALLYTVGGIVAFIIVTGSIFMIYNAFTISLNERTRQFGILSSVGATAKQLRNAVLFEGLCIGAAGIPVGILLGIGSMGLVLTVVSKNFGNILYSHVPLTLQVSIPAIACAAALSMITILISAYIPARKAAGTPVMESIRQSNEVKVEAKAVKTSGRAQRIYGLEGTLALKNFKRNKKRYRSIVLSLMLSVVLFISASAFVTYMKQMSERAVAFTTYDIGFATQSMKDSEMLALYDKLRTAGGIWESSYQTLMKVTGIAQASDLSDAYWGEEGASGAAGKAGNDGKSGNAVVPSPVRSDEQVSLPVDLQFLDDSAYLKILEGLGLPAAEYTGPDAKFIAVAKLMSPADDKRLKEVDGFCNLFKSSSSILTLTPKSEDGSKIEQGHDVSVTFVETVPPDTLPVTGSPGSNQPFFFRVIAPYSLIGKFEAADSPPAVKGLTFRSKHPAQSVAEMEKTIQGAQITDEYKLYNVYAMMDESRNTIFIINVFAYTFIIMISLIAIANVFNTISTNIKLRRRELAMLRSIGMSDRNFQRMMNFECAFYGMRALISGLPIGLVFSWLIYRGMFIGGADQIDYIFPWASIGISVFSVLLIVFVTMLYSVSTIKRENIIDALRDDMT
ncbi:putative ABC transport system permease [Paenibacillus sp. FSL R7-269]|uniref:ABC transporter permease n=1 Tax=Paenibacillus sp. FSL R7-269 TaxID=1226755 RepID=UPI0003E2AD3A|nr:FtsX-like permease family protein [Paenibacillus sp. FSL R7-269]ETT56223.1 putative ABC transport system permease [Paenibacillus sp. FSL R7-269]